MAYSKNVESVVQQMDICIAACVSKTGWPNRR